jgi:tetratricopeptide (TPR) repeat protein
VKPITSEPIFVITKGGGLKLVVPAGSSVPSEKPFVENLRVSRDGQIEIELPMCVSNGNKLLGILRIESEDDGGFSESEVIVITCSITHDKLLEATAKVGGVERKVTLLNPLSNTELSPKELLMLEAKQHYNESLILNNGRPSARATLTYAHALSDAGLYLEAAEQFIQADELDKAANHATMICYCYAMGHKTKASNAWAEIAYTRKKDGVTIYNYALTKRDDRNLYEKLLKQALVINPNLPFALNALGGSLLSQGKQEGLMHLEKASILLKNKLISNEATSSDCDLLLMIGKKLGRDDLGDAAQARKRLLHTNHTAHLGSQAFDEANLASADSNSLTVSG